VAAQYTWTNTQTFTNTITFNSTILGTVNNALYLGGAASSSYQLNSTLNANIASYLPTYTGIVNASALQVGTTDVINSTGIYTTGSINAYSVNGSVIQVSSTFVANSSQLTITTPLSANGGVGTAGQILTTNGATGSPYWSTIVGVNVSAQYVWTNTQSFSNAITFNSTANLIFSSGAKIIDSTGSQGSTGQVLTSNGTGNVYWSTVSGGGGSVNTANQYVWTNTQTFNSNVLIYGSANVGIGNSTPVTKLLVTGTVSLTPVTIASSNNININCASGNYFVATCNGSAANIYFTSGQPGVYYSMILKLANGGTNTISWANTPKWPNATAPYASTNTDIWIFVTDDGGSTWRGSQAIKDSR